MTVRESLSLEKPVFASVEKDLHMVTTIVKILDFSAWLEPIDTTHRRKVNNMNIPELAMRHDSTCATQIETVNPFSTAPPLQQPCDCYAEYHALQQGAIWADHFVSSHRLGGSFTQHDGRRSYMVVDGNEELLQIADELRELCVSMSLNKGREGGHEA